MDTEMEVPAVEASSPQVEEFKADSGPTAVDDSPMVEADSPKAVEEAGGEGEKADNKAEQETIQRLTKFPMGRVKHLMKLDPDTTMASQESVYVVAKALEMFVESLAKEAFGYTEKAKKKTVAKTDVEKAIDTADCLAFLEGAMDD